MRFPYGNKKKHVIFSINISLFQMQFYTRM